MTQLYVEESPDSDKTHWYLSFGKTKFQGADYIEVDEKTAQEILQIKRND